MIPLEEVRVYVIGCPDTIDTHDAVGRLQEAGALVVYTGRPDQVVDRTEQPYEWFEAEVQALLAADIAVSVPSSLATPEARSLLQVAIAGHARLMTLAEAVSAAA